MSARSVKQTRWKEHASPHGRDGIVLARGLRKKTHTRLGLNRDGKDWFVLARRRHACPRDSWSKQDGRKTLKRLGTDRIDPIRFFFHYPRLSGTQRQKCKGGGGIAFQRSGVGDWVALLSKGFTQRHHQSTHFSFFRGRRHRVTAALDGDKHQRREGLWRSAEHERAVRPRGTFTDRMMCNCVGFHDGLTREHRTWVNN